ncbi:replication initiator, partial [Frankia sp. Cj3]|uniref:replication initiator n=1 Tax=Frankia sp. Cj3 TaxID=2880976 RepID=UPI0035B10969
ATNRNTGRLIGYLTKYLTKSLDTCHAIATDAQRAHVDRLAEALRFEPCSPTCANWLRYGVQPKNPKAGLVPGRCRGKAHRRETLGFGGRRVLVSRKWSGKTLTDHREDRKMWIREQLAILGHTGTDDAASGRPDRVVWQLLRPGDPAAPRREHLLLRAVADRHHWRTQLDAARAAQAARGHPNPVSATDPGMPRAA